VEAETKEMVQRRIIGKEEEYGVRKEKGDSE
jgi:hypothetical protein